MDITKKEILSAMKELEEAMLESISLNAQEKDIKVLKIKAHKRLSLARDEVRSLTFN